MKVKQENKGFQNVTITLESQKEIDKFAAVMDNVTGDNTLSEFTNDLYNLLDPYSDDDAVTNIETKYISKSMVLK